MRELVLEQSVCPQETGDLHASSCTGNSTIVRRHNADHRKEDNVLVVAVLARVGNRGILIIVVIVASWLWQQWIPTLPPPGTTAMAEDTCTGGLHVVRRHDNDHDCC